MTRSGVSVLGHCALNPRWQNVHKQFKYPFELHGGEEGKKREKKCVSIRYIYI